MSRNDGYRLKGTMTFMAEKNRCDVMDNFMFDLHWLVSRYIHQSPIFWWDEGIMLIWSHHPNAAKIKHHNDAQVD